ncbi:MAG: hypothetical protein A2788_01755 [Candidatus Abawacabacteria bacterium RIFCSPHIGHO2_01_FULL_46_8]|uniref:SLH domain-containing protein n=1 Tax=Candidatus Abawacabacteria bacterium RIFCSPHIGHO2_01_FULL_46_8 TaxID=1817815 RepID=A0A1F4XLM5_9BACT|nr:MAG: hypothetical protein A2788_01755 [Candidatus Abawacabacteria bacterium RIFCSPHIGHO2_01_FULL_46_8]
MPVPWKNISKTKRVICARICAFIIALSFLYPLSAGASELRLAKDFIDLPPGHWADDLVQELVEKQAFPPEVIIGNKFGPDKILRRDETLLLFYRGLGLPVIHHPDSDGDGISDQNEFKLGTDPTRQDTDRDGYADLAELVNGYDPISQSKAKKAFADLFKDISLGTWQYDLVYQAKLDELISGYVDGTFRADEPITRVEFIKIGAIAGKLKLEPVNESPFTDVKDGHWSIPYLKAAISQGLISSDQAEFKPQKSISRVEAAKIVAKLSKISRID